jgi:cytochrome P450
MPPATTFPLHGNLLVAHGGGPTAVLNASLYGLIREAARHAQVEGIYGARFGTQGLLEGDFLDLRREPAASLEAGDLSGEELYGTVTLVFIAGFLTTTNLLGNGLVALLSNPEQQERLWADPDRWVEPAVEEMLRYDTPVQMVHRVARQDTELGGHTVKDGETVFCLLGAADRDPARFEDPDAFRIDRPDNLHLSFAWGLHFCLGARLARLEAQLVFAGLARRFSSVGIDGPAPRRPGLLIRGLESLPVQVTPR